VTTSLGCWTIGGFASTVERMPASSAKPRRAPDPGERQRDAERTRQRILDAALAEFADRGYAGARVRSIADRAGVNSQLISYYFGGKEGLYQAILRRWHEREASIEEQDLLLGDAVVAYLQAGFDQPELMRIFIWEGLAGSAPPDVGLTSDTEAPEVVAFRERQAAGEIAAVIDPAYLLVALMGAVATPVTMPQTIERLCGVPADSAEFRSRFAEQLRLIVRHLAAPSPDGAAPERPPPRMSRGRKP
jgi:TetR/AcrR family transcriptional regulator